MDPRLPYDAPPPVRGQFTQAYRSSMTLPIPIDIVNSTDFTNSDLEVIRAAYDEEIAFFDQQLGRLREGLTARGVIGRRAGGVFDPSQALIVLTGDHGEELFDHGGFGHGLQTWQEVLHVPLVIWGPGVEAGREPTPVSLTDLMPTILEWAGIPSAPGLDGVSLWPNLSTGAPLADRALFMEATYCGPPRTAMIRWPWKIVMGMGNQLIRVANLDADYGERVDLSRFPPEPHRRPDQRAGTANSRCRARQFGDRSPTGRRDARETPLAGLSPVADLRMLCSGWPRQRAL